ncbi:MAG: hypothetical protein ACKPKO_59320, partial [Candidatus Fonsibacter sp.]
CGSGYGKQGLYGTQSKNLHRVMNGSANRAWRSARQITQVRKTTTVVSHEDSQLIFQCITRTLPICWTREKLSRTTSYPYTKQHGSNTCHPDRSGGKRMTMGVFSDPQAKTLYSSSIKLTCIPDKIVVCVRNNIGGLTCSDADSYATIKT